MENFIFSAKQLQEMYNCYKIILQKRNWNEQLSMFLFYDAH